MAAPKQTTIYAKEHCPFCTKIKRLYEEKGWPYTHYILDKNFTRGQFIEEYGRNATFPQLVVDGERTGGCNETIALFRQRGIL